MAEPLAIAHLTAADGQRLCGAADHPLALDVSIEVLSDGHWGARTSVARCPHCVQIFGPAPVAA